MKKYVNIYDSETRIKILCEKKKTRFGKTNIIEKMMISAISLIFIACLAGHFCYFKSFAFYFSFYLNTTLCKS